MTRISFEQFGKAQTAAQLATSFARSLVYKADGAFLSQVAPTPPAVAPPAGLQNISGLVDAEATVGLDGTLDALVDLIAAIEKNNSHPSHIIVDTLGWAALRKLKLATGWHANLLGAGTEDAQQLLFSIPVLVNRFGLLYTGYVVDRNAIAAAARPVRIAQSEHAYFGADSIALRATRRIGVERRSAESYRPIRHQ